MSPFEIMFGTQPVDIPTAFPRINVPAADASADGLKGEGRGRSFGAGASGQSTSAEHNTNTYNL